MLRRRLDRIENHAHATMNDAQEVLAHAEGTLSRTEKALAGLVAQMSALVLVMTATVRELNDGVQGEVEIGGSVFGRPTPVVANVRWRVNLLEEDDEPAAKVADASPEPPAVA